MLWRPHTVEWIPGCPPRLYSRHCSPPPAPDNPPPYTPNPDTPPGGCRGTYYYDCTATYGDLRTIRSQLNLEGMYPPRIMRCVLVFVPDPALCG